MTSSIDETEPVPSIVPAPTTSSAVTSVDAGTSTSPAPMEIVEDVQNQSETTTENQEVLIVLWLQ